MNDKVLANKIKIYTNLKQKNNLMMNLILQKEYFQDKVDLVKLKNVSLKMIKKIMQLK